MRTAPFSFIGIITILMAAGIAAAQTPAAPAGPNHKGQHMQTDSTTTGKQPGLLFSPGPQGWWDSERVSSPQIIREPDGTWKMWYYGRDASFDRMINLPSGRCGMAVSRDGIAWERVRGPLTMGAVFEPVPAEKDRFDNAHVGISDISYEAGLYWMWYFGGDQTLMDLPMGGQIFKVKGVFMQPGCAISRDGISWIRLEGPYRGAFLDRGAPGDWDAMFCSWPRVLKDQSGYKMYYHTYQPMKNLFLPGMAVSQDGFQWQKKGQIMEPGAPGSFDEGGMSCRHVLKIGGRYLMFYEGINKSTYYCIGLALSDDGITWRKDDAGSQPGGPVFSHAAKGSGRWDAKAVGAPFVVPMPDGSYRMYYVGANEGGRDELSSKHQIGLAVSDGSDFRTWRRWGE